MSERVIEERLERRNADLCERIDELLVSNNAFEQRAREAERALKAARETLSLVEGSRSSTTINNHYGVPSTTMLARAQRDEALAHFKEALAPIFMAGYDDWNRLRRYFAWAKRAAHPGMSWPSLSESNAIFGGLEWAGLPVIDADTIRARLKKSEEDRSGDP